MPTKKKSPSSVARLTRPTPAGVKKRGTPQAFKERASTRYDEYLRRTENVRSVAGKRLRQRKVRMVRGYMKMMHDTTINSISTHIVGDAFSKIRMANTREAELGTLRVAMQLMNILVKGPWKNAVGIRVAVFEKNTLDRWVQVPMKEIEKHYRNVYVRDQAEDDPVGFLRGGKLGAGMDEAFVIPVSILEDLRRTGTYDLLQPVEKEFFNAMYTWFRERTPDNVYALLTNKNIPAWYAKDLRNHMRLMGVSS